MECIHTYTRDPIPEDKLTELMVITAEECGEVVQECMKILRFGISETNIIRLEKEVGDLLCMYDLLVKYNCVDKHRVSSYTENKRQKLKTYSNLIEEEL